MRRDYKSLFFGIKMILICLNSRFGLFQFNGKKTIRIFVFGNHERRSFFKHFFIHHFFFFFINKN